MADDKGSLDFYRSQSSLPFPQSFSTALRAFRSHQIPVEPVIYRAGSADTMFQQPLNIPLIKEVLAFSRMNADVNRDVARLLFAYVGDEDGEVSDFAAQHLAKLEERYQREIRKAEAEARENPDLTIRLARLYLEFAGIEQFNPTLQRFYLKKGQEIVELAETSNRPESDVGYMAFRFTVELGDYQKAGEIVERYSGAARTAGSSTEPAAQAERSIRRSSPADDRRWLLARLELAYVNRDVRTAAALAAKLKSNDKRTEDDDDVIRQWTEHHV